MLTSKLIDGSFPDYARVIPTANKKLLLLENADLVKAVDRVSTLSSEKGRAVKLNASEGHRGRIGQQSRFGLRNGGNRRRIQKRADRNRLQRALSARHRSADRWSKALFKLADGSSPTLISDESDASALYVLMPMRV